MMARRGKAKDTQRSQNPILFVIGGVIVVILIFASLNSGSQPERDVLADNAISTPASTAPSSLPTALPDGFASSIPDRPPTSQEVTTQPITTPEPVVDSTNKTPYKTLDPPFNPLTEEDVSRIWATLPKPQAPLATPLTPLSPEVAKEKRREIAKYLRRQAGVQTIEALETTPGQLANHWNCDAQYAKFKPDYGKHKPELYYLIGQHLKLSDALLRDESLEVRSSALEAI